MDLCQGQLKTYNMASYEAGHTELLSGLCSREFESHKITMIIVAVFFIPSFSGMVTGSVFNKHKLLLPFLERNQVMTGLLPPPDSGPFKDESSNFF